MKRIILAAIVAAAVAATIVWIARSRPPAPTPETRLNILLITIDTLRADRVGRGLMPAIDDLAARGTSFAGVRATVPLTLPSHLSLMTGTIPPVHGVRDNGVVFDRKQPTIARVFRDAGYATGAFVGAYVLNRRFGLDEGFDVYDDRVTRHPERAARLEAERPASAVVDAAIEWLSSLVRIGPRTADGGPRTAVLPLGPPLRSARALHAAGGVPAESGRKPV